MSWFLIFAFAARAADPAPATLLPSAVAVEQGQGEVSVTAAHLTIPTWSGQQGGVGTVRAGYAPVDRLWVELSAGVLDLGVCPDACGAENAMVPFTLTARYNVVQTQHFGLAPVILAGGDLEEGAVAGAGIALEGGGDRVRADFTLVGWGIVAPEPNLFVPVYAETGVRFLVGRESRHQLRAGLNMVLPDLSWRYEHEDHWFVEAGIVGLPFNLGAERLEVGYRF